MLLRGSFCCSSLRFWGGKGSFCMVFLEELGTNLLWLCSYLGVKVFCRCSPLL